jgi:hypothetical protein
MSFVQRFVFFPQQWPTSGCGELFRLKGTGFGVCVRTKKKPRISPLRYPEFPVEFGGVGELHAAFLERKPHTRLRPAMRGRKSGFAPVEMTIC